eukprot:gene7509-biopygen10584
MVRERCDVQKAFEPGVPFLHCRRTTDDVSAQQLPRQKPRAAIAPPKNPAQQLPRQNPCAAIAPPKPPRSNCPAKTPAQQLPRQNPRAAIAPPKPLRGHQTTARQGGGGPGLAAGAPAPHPRKGRGTQNCLPAYKWWDWQGMRRAAFLGWGVLGVWWGGVAG